MAGYATLLCDHVALTCCRSIAYFFRRTCPSSTQSGRSAYFSIASVASRSPRSRTVQRPHPPILIGGDGRHFLERLELSTWWQTVGSCSVSISHKGYVSFAGSDRQRRKPPDMIPS